jgi:hypothetical protein
MTTTSAFLGRFEFWFDAHGWFSIGLPDAIQWDTVDIGFANVTPTIAFGMVTNMVLVTHPVNRNNLMMTLLVP